jgi:hypothetical protein
MYSSREYMEINIQRTEIYFIKPGGTGQNYNMDRDILNAWTPKIPIPIFQDLLRGILPELL